MARFKQSIVINRPVEQVFRFVSDLGERSALEWECRDATHLAGPDWHRHDVPTE